MTDPLDDLKNTFAQTTPTPDFSAKSDNLARAQDIFEKIHGVPQGSADDLRPTFDRPKFGAGIFRGAHQMFAKLTSRQGLTATTALIAVGMVAMIPVLQKGPPTLDLAGSETYIQEPPNTQPDARLNLAEAEVIVAEELAVEVAGEHAIAAPRPVPMVEMAAPKKVRRPDSIHLSNPAGMGIVGPAGVPGLADTNPNSARSEADDGLTFGLFADHEQAADGHMSRDTGVVNGILTGSIVQSGANNEMIVAPNPNTETFANDTPNPVKIAKEEPVSTFSIDVDTASYSVVRSSLMNGYLPNADAVRIEEMVNYFPYDYAAPKTAEGPFKPTVSITPTPWNADTQLMHIAIQGEMPAVEDRPALNLVFLIDTSGSMSSQNKLPLLKQSFRLMLGQLSPEDEVSIVTYAGSAGRVLDPTPASKRTTILAALDRLDAGGSTAGQAGLQQAYATAESMAEEGQVTRVILATDGDFNVGINNPDELKDFIAEKRDTGTYLSVLGFGRGNLDDATMQALAQNGNGQAAYIDTLSEAQKVLIDQLTGALFPIANDVKIQVEFNPNTVAEYRLIGYETRALAREDFNNDKVDAGEIGAGHSVTAIYEITPVGSPAILNDPLRYSVADDSVGGGEDELAFLRLRYKTPGEDSSQLIEIPVTADIGGANSDARFAAAIASFGQLLQNSTYVGDWSFGDTVALAQDSIGADPYGYRREAVTLMRLAQSLTE